MASPDMAAIDRRSNFGMDETCLEIKRLNSRMKAEQGNWVAVWQDIADYMVPWRANISTRSTPGRKLTDRIFESTAPQALTTAASAVHSSVTPSTLRWFSLNVSNPDVRNAEGVIQWLDDVSNLAFAVISNSNFDSEAQEVYSDLFAFGTALMVVEDDTDEMGLEGQSGIRFHAQQPGSFCIKEGANGRVDTVIREVPMNVGSVVARWGLANVSQRVQDLFANHRVEEGVDVLHYIGPRKDGIAGDYAPSRKRIASIWLESSGGAYSQTAAQYLTKLSESGFDEMPVMAPRWRKMSGEVYGRSPGMVVLPDVRTINKAVELRLKAWTLAIAPPIMTQDRGVIGQIRLEPYGRIYTRPGATVETLDIPARFDVANFQEEQLRTSIKAGFFVDLLQFQAKDGTPISATEASIRFQTMQKILGPVVSRLQSEFLAPLVMRVLHVLERNRLLPPAPPAVADSGGLELFFEGPLARVQRATNVESINQFFSLVFPVAEISREVIARIDFNEVVETLAEATSLPARLLRSREAAAELLAAQDQAAQQQQLMANVLEAGKTVQGAAGAPV